MTVNTKRPILPHKGGRSKNINIRCTEDVKNIITEIASEQGISPSKKEEQGNAQVQN